MIAKYRHRFLDKIVLEQKPEAARSGAVRQ
jgi:hypothetical protein